MDVKGPLMKIPLADIAKRGHVGLIAGGSGLTPMLQVAEEALRHKLPVKVCGVSMTCVPAFLVCLCLPFWVACACLLVHTPHSAALPCSAPAFKPSWLRLSPFPRA